MLLQTKVLLDPQGDQIEHQQPGPVIPKQGAVPVGTHAPCVAAVEQDAKPDLTGAQSEHGDGGVPPVHGADHHPAVGQLDQPRCRTIGKCNTEVPGLFVPSVEIG